MGSIDSDGWHESAHAWITEQGEQGDWARCYVLDPAMLAIIRSRSFRRALDVGCGEGRFCRLLHREGLAAVGIDPTEALLNRARSRDPGGDYRSARAEALPFSDEFFDLVVSYLTLIDIPDIEAAIAEMARVLQPGGTLLIANLTGYSTAAVADTGWVDGRFAIDHYLEERANWAAWSGIRVRNWHRPLETYMQLLLGAGLVLRHFAEPAPVSGDPGHAARYRRVPFLVLMAWDKPGSSAATLPSVQPPPSAL